MSQINQFMNLQLKKENTKGTETLTMKLVKINNASNKYFFYILPLIKKYIAYELNLLSILLNLVYVIRQYNHALR